MGRAFIVSILVVIMVLTVVKESSADDDGIISSVTGPLKSLAGNIPPPLGETVVGVVENIESVPNGK